MAAAAPKAAAPEGVQSELGASNQFSVRRQLGLDAGEYLVLGGNKKLSVARASALGNLAGGWCGYCWRYLFHSCLRTVCLGCRRI